jgi:hypothetical protein
MKRSIVVYILPLVLHGCASIRGYHADPDDVSSPIIYGSGLGDRSYLTPDGTREWEAKECKPWRVKLSHGHLLRGVASPGETLYYYRCREPNEYKKLLKELRSRTLYRPEVNHHPIRNKER